MRTRRSVRDGSCREAGAKHRPQGAANSPTVLPPCPPSKKGGAIGGVPARPNKPKKPNKVL